MKDLLNNELLSAYLDGELSPAERAEVEQLLAANPAARKLLDELRALSTTLKSLPRERLGEDLSESVLEIAQRRLSSRAAAEPVVAEAKPVPLSRTVFRRFNNPRMWVWEAIIVAVVVLLLVYNPDRNAPQGGRGERNIAMAPKDKETPASGARSRALAAKSAEEPLAGKRAFSEVQGPSIQAVPAPATVERLEGLDVKIVGKKAADASGRSGLAVTEGQPVAQGKAAGIAPTERQPVAQPETPAMERLADEAAKKDVGDRLDGGEDKSPLAERRPTATSGASAPARSDVQQQTDLGENLARDAIDSATATPALVIDNAEKPATPPTEKELRDRAKQKAVTAQELVVVRCQITPEAVSKQAFDKLLSSNGIVWSETPAPTLADDVRQQAEAFKSLIESGANRAPGVYRRGAGETETVRRPAKGRRASEPGTPAPVEIVYVEAPPEQIKATINALASQSHEFRTVSVAPANSEYQVSQLSAEGKRDWEMSKPLSAAKGARAFDNAPTNSFYQTTPGAASSAASNVVLGRAQRIMLNFDYDYGTTARESSARKQDAADFMHEATPQTTASGAIAAGQGGAMRAEDAFGAAQGGGFGGSAAQSQFGQPSQPARALSGAKKPAAAKSEQLQMQTVQKGPEGKAEQSQAKAAQQPSAGLAEMPPVSPVPSQALGTDQASQKPQQPLQTDSLEKFGYMPSGQAALPGMQRALFVLQIIGDKDSSAESGKAAASRAKAAEPAAAEATQSPTNAVPNQPGPANAAPGDADRK